MDVSVLIPCKGRAAQTTALIDRLLQPEIAGAVAWELICIVDDDPDVDAALAPYADRIGIISLAERHGYWKALGVASAQARGRLLVNAANDVLPGLRWIERAVRVFDRSFPDGRGVLGFNDGLLFDGHTGHLMISRALAEEWYGAACWPTWYDHLFGDTEICQRAMQQDRYVVALKAVLFHNHPIIGQANDAVYAFSHTHEGADADLFRLRRGAQWIS